ncbi:MAG TPA: hypothetical protein VFE34_07500 [Dongiaceae bacterium]|jgi:hypothetical protein|nr:hypothetical protein [Dongiaceae bacterium]
MDKISTAALDHVRLMEARIEQQTALIVQLKAAGENTLDAAQRLDLLRRAAEEIRMQLGELLPTEAKPGFKSVR